MTNTSIASSGKQYSDAQQIDAALQQCKVLAMQSLLTFVSSLLYFILAATRMVSAIATLGIAVFSFILWCATVW